MDFRHLLFLSICLSMFACSTSTSKQTDIALEIKLLNEQMEQAYREGRLLDLAAIYHDDGHLLSPGGQHLTGRAEIDQYWEGISNPIDWQLEVLAVATSEEEIFAHPAWNDFEQKPPHWQEFGINVSPDTATIYQLGQSTLQYKRDDVVRTSVVDFILVWTPAPDGTYKILIDSYH